MPFGLIFAPAARRLPVTEGLRKETCTENMMMTHGINVDGKILWSSAEGVSVTHMHSHRK